MEFVDLTQKTQSFINPKLRQGFKLDEVIILPNKGEIICQGQRCHLTPKALELLLFLCENHNQIVSSEDLIMCGWGDPKTKRSLLTHVISEIRHALDDHKECPEFIQTLPRKGYRMIARISALDEKVLYPSAWSFNSAISPETNNKEFNSHWRLSFALLKNSKLLSVSVGFFVATWVLLQVFELVFPIFDVPEWGLKIAVLILVIGFPLALMFTWLKEIKIKKQVFNQQKDESKKKCFFKQLAIDFSFIGFLSIGMGFVALYLIESIELEQNEQSLLTKKSSFNLPLKDNLIAVLPFQFDNPKNLPDYFNATFQGELIHALTRQNYFKMVSQRATNDLDKSSKLTDYAERLGARYLLDGQINAKKIGFTIFINLIDSKTSLQVWSASIDGTSENLMAAQKSVYRQVFNALTLLSKQPADEQKNVISTNDFKSYDSYIQGKNQLDIAKNSDGLIKAEKFFLTALNFDPGFSLASAGLCQTYLDQYSMSREVTAFDSAKKRCGALLSISQLKEEAYVALGNLNRISGEQATAINFYQRALELNPQNIDAISGKGLSSHELGNSLQAEILLQKSIEIEPGYWKNYLTFGDFLFSVGKYHKAIEQYLRVTLLKPDYEQGFNRLGAAYYLDDKLEKATIAWQKSLKIEPNANNYSNLGSVLFFQHKFRSAQEHYQKAVEMRQADPILWGNLGDSQKFANNKIIAEKSYETAISLAVAQLKVNPNDISIQASLARYQSETAQCESALIEMDKLALLQSTDPYLMYDLALIAINCEKIKQAKTFIERAVSLGYSKKLLARDIQFKAIFSKIIVSS